MIVEKWHFAIQARWHSLKIAAELGKQESTAHLLDFVFYFSLPGHLIPPLPTGSLMLSHQYAQKLGVPWGFLS